MLITLNTRTWELDTIKIERIEEKKGTRTKINLLLPWSSEVLQELKSFKLKKSESPWNRKKIPVAIYSEKIKEDFDVVKVRVYKRWRIEVCLTHYKPDPVKVEAACKELRLRHSNHYQCPKCNYKFQFFVRYDVIGLGEYPFCHRCFIEFIKAHVPLGQRYLDEHG